VGEDFGVALFSFVLEPGDDVRMGAGDAGGFSGTVRRIVKGRKATRDPSSKSKIPKKDGLADRAA